MWSLLHFWTFRLRPVAMAIPLVIAVAATPVLPTPVAMAEDLQAVDVAAQTASADPFASVRNQRAIPVGERLALPLWETVRGPLAQDIQALTRCVEGGSCPSGALGDYGRFLATVGDRSVEHKLTAINEYVNRQRYKADQANFGVADRWQSPSAFLGAAGDCEDFALAKLAGLAAVGIDLSDLKLIVGYDDSARDYHALLGVTIDGSVRVLDNLTDRIRTLDTHSAFTPRYAVNVMARWVFVSLS